jgi:hypothetical protein
VLDRFLHIAHRFAPEPFAERISLLIWKRECDRRWNASVAKHKSAGGVVMTLEHDAGATVYFL